MGTVISLVSAKGSPGVTTTAAVLAATGSGLDQPVCWVELDPSGGSGWLRSRASCQDSAPTLAEVARELREVRAEVGWAAMASIGPPGVRSVLAPTSELATSSVIAEGPDRWAGSLVTDGVVVVDAGRWDRRQALADRIGGSNVVGVVCRATVESVEHTRHWVAGLRSQVDCPVTAVVVGSRPYSGAEVADALALPLAGVVEWRPSDVTALWSRGATRPVLRSWLGRSAAQTLAGLLARIPPSVSDPVAADQVAS